MLTGFNLISTLYTLSEWYILYYLPRPQRFLLENVIVCAIIPGPNEPKHNINSCLRKMVEELQILWKGIVFTLSTSPLPVHIRAALLFVAADIPGTRKACGFTGHNSSKGCSKCLKQQPALKLLSLCMEKNLFSESYHWSRDITVTLYFDQLSGILVLIHKPSNSQFSNCILYIVGIKSILDELCMPILKVGN